MDEEYERWRADQAHAYLERIRLMGDDCAGLQAQIEDAYARAEGMRGIDYAAIRVNVSPGADAIPNAVAELEGRIREYVGQLRDYEEQRHEASQAMMAMRDQNEARVLRLRYLLGRKWERICAETDYSWDGMMKLRRRALADYWDVMPREHRSQMPRAL